MSPESWQNVCPRCGWANSGAERRCMKCGQPLRTSPGLLVAGQSSAAAISPGSEPAVRKVVQPGGFFPRLIALIIDILILAVIAVPIAYLFLSQSTDTSASGGQANAFGEQLRGLAGTGSRFTAAQLTQFFQLAIGLAILQLFYYVGTWSILGGSPGQLVMSLRVVDASARTIGFGRALYRYFLKGLFGVLAPVSALMVAIGADKRALHDVFAGTYVIQFLDPKLEDFESVLPSAQASPVPPEAPPAPVVSTVPQEVYAGAALAAAAVTNPPPAPPAAPPEPVQPLSPVPASAAAPPPPPAPPAPPMAPAPADHSAFERYSAPGESPAPTPAPPSQAPAVPITTPPTAAPGPATAADAAAAPDPALPVFPTADPSGLQPMAPAPVGRPDPSREAGAQPDPYSLPFAPARPPAEPPEEAQP